MSERKANNKQLGGFPKAYNPHLKRNQKLKKPQEENKKINQETEILEQKEKNIPILLNKEYLAKQLIENGYIDSYIDFFYLGWKKTPNMKKKYTEKKEDEEEDQKVDENFEEEGSEEDINIPRHDYNLETLEGFYYKLKDAEDALRKSELQQDPQFDIEAIDKYNTIRNETLYQGVPLEAIYFNQKCIDIAKKNNHTESLIQSLIYMGDCFDKTNLPSDMNISKNLKEEAKNIYKEKLDGKNYALESSIYKALKDLYNELAIQQEQSKNYKKAIELLHKLLEVLETAKTIIGKVKNGLTEKEIEDKKTEAYLKIANIYYIIKDYDHTISTLDLIPDIKKEDYSSLTPYQIQGLYRYAQTYEMQGNRDYAIAYLEHIDKAANTQATDDTILAKSLLHLGRLYFKAGTFELSHKFLNKFYRKSKNIDTKELLDIARVNLGMIDGTQDMESYINKIKNETYEQI